MMPVRSLWNGAALLAIGLAAGCAQNAPVPGTPTALEQGSIKLVFNGPVKFADRMSATQPFSQWSDCTRAALGTALGKPVTVVNDQPAQLATLIAAIPNATLVVQVKSVSATGSRATIYTTTDSADNAANVKTVMAEVRKCASS